MTDYSDHVDSIVNSVDPSISHKKVAHYAMFFTGKGRHTDRESIVGSNYSISDYSIHAEVDALNKITRKADKSDIYNLLVVRFTKNNKIGESRPCMYCLLKLAQSKYVKIKYVYYSTSDGTINRENFSDMLDAKKHISKGHRRKLRKAKMV